MKDSVREKKRNYRNEGTGKKEHWFKHFIDIQTSKTLIQMDINKMMRMEFIQ